MEELIDCSVYCPYIIKQMNACPRKEIDFSRFTLSSNLFELFMVFLSVTPYILSFLHFITTAYYKTIRSAMVLIMLYSQTFAIKVVKDIFQDPRPNFKCNNQYGNPSNHSTFFASLVVWNIMEYIFLEARARYSNSNLKTTLFIITPMVCYSRYYLRYHSVSQIVNGVILGSFISVFWFLFTDYAILKGNSTALINIFTYLGFSNNMITENIKMKQNRSHENFVKKLMDLKDKEKEISQIKNNLEDFTNTLENLDFIKDSIKGKKQL
jgi:membrane-associated phospholipid phosphatase